MKKMMILYILLFFAVMLVKAEGFILRGELTNAPEGAWIYRMNAKGTAYHDSVQIKQGRFEFRGNVVMPELQSIHFFKDPAQRIYGWDKILMIPVYMENSEIRVSIPFSDMPNKLAKEMPASLQIEGSQSHNLYTEYQRTVASMNVRHSALFDEYRRYFYYKKGTEEDVFRTVRAMDAVKDSIYRYGVAFVERNGGSPIGLWVARQLGVRNYGRAVAGQVVELLPPAVRMTEEGQKAVRALTERPLYVADAMPDMQVVMIDGKEVSLSSLLKEGRYTLVELWASWCGPCRSDIPRLKDIYDTYNDRGFDIISISIDDDRAKWQKAVREENMGWMQVCGVVGKGYKKECMTLFGMSGVPSCILVDPAGKVVSLSARGGWLSLLLSEIMK